MNSPVAGIDIGEEKGVATCLSSDEDLREHFTFGMNPEGCADFAKRIPRETRIAFDASGSAYAVSISLCALGYRDLTVAHPKELSWIIKSKNKNDHVDSVKLAKLHLVGMLPESRLLDDDSRILRDLLIQRVKVGRSIGKAKNSILGYLKREDLFKALPRMSDNFSAKRRDAMKTIRFNNAKDLVLATMKGRLEFFEEQ